MKLLWLALIPLTIYPSQITYEIPKEAQKAPLLGPQRPMGPFLAEMKKKNRSVVPISQKLTEKELCSCVSYARFKSGFAEAFGPPKEKGWAKHWPTNINRPTTGGVVVLDVKGNNKFAKIDHVAFIESVDWEKGTFKVSESHVNGCGITARTLSIADPHIIGFWAR